MAERGIQVQQKYDEAYLRWEHAVTEIAAELDALVVGETLHTGWLTLSRAVAGLYRLSGTWSQPWRSQLIEELMTVYPEGATDWRQLADAVSHCKSEQEFQSYFAAWWKLREVALSGCAEFGRLLRAS